MEKPADLFDEVEKVAHRALEYLLFDGVLTRGQMADN
jgi:hypothetical protein